MIAVGIPKEIKTDEKRVALIPSDCGQIIKQGFEVILENNGGLLAGFSNRDYQDAGVKISPDPISLYNHSDILVKVKEPQLSEISMLKEKHTLFCFLHLGGNIPLSEELKKTGVTAYAYETVEENGKTPLLTPMSQIAGHLSILMSSNFLTSTYGGKGLLFGKNPFHEPAHILVLGAGSAGQTAMDVAYRLGARLTVVDTNKSVLEDMLKKYPGISAIKSTADNLLEIMPGVDVLIGAVYVYGRKAPHIITREMIKLLPKGSVAFDIAVDQGGCFETTRPCTHSNPIYMEESVVHSAITNLPAAVPHSASISLSKNIMPYVLELASENISPALKKGLNIQNRKIMLDL